MKLKKIIFFIVLILIYITGYSQGTGNETALHKVNSDSIAGWKKGGIFIVNFSQASLSNWSAGGKNSISLNGLTSVFLNYHQIKYFWDNSLDLGYGFLKQGKNEKSQKTDDKVDFLSQYGIKTSKNWYLAGLLNFKTQMAPGFNYPNDSVKISDFFAPAYLIGAVGIDYKPNSVFSVFLSPLTYKLTIVHDQKLADIGAFGVDKAVLDINGKILEQGKKSKTALGGYVRVIYTQNKFKSEILKNVSLTTKLDLFSNYLDKPQNIVINWENIIAFKVNRFIAVNINTLLIYDDNIRIQEKLADGTINYKGPKIQFKELIGLGVSYKF